MNKKYLVIFPGDLSNVQAEMWCLSEDDMFRQGCLETLAQVIKHATEYEQRPEVSIHRKLGIVDPIEKHYRIEHDKAVSEEEEDGEWGICEWFREQWEWFKLTYMT